MWSWVRRGQTLKLMRKDSRKGFRVAFCVHVKWNRGRKHFIYQRTSSVRQLTTVGFNGPLSGKPGASCSVGELKPSQAALYLRALTSRNASLIIVLNRQRSLHWPVVFLNWFRCYHTRCDIGIGWEYQSIVFLLLNYGKWHADYSAVYLDFFVRHV